MTEKLTPMSAAIKAEIDRLRGGPRGKPTQEEIAEAIGRTQPYVSDRISGGMSWTANDLNNLAPLFGMDAFELIASARSHLDVGGSLEDVNFSTDAPKNSVGLAAKKGTKKADAEPAAD